MNKRVEINRLSTGVPGLDDVLGGGFPEYSFNLIAGAPGGGKTTLAHQIMFAGASVERPALYVTIVGEPPVKMLRYQQQYSFFDETKIPGCIRFLHLAGDVFEGGLAKVLESITREVDATSPRLVFVDSFRALVRRSESPGEMDLQSFVQRLSLHLTSLEATTFLIGEYEGREAESNPIFTVADGILWLSQVPDRGSVVRRIQVMKMRGQAPLAGLHTMNISGDGLRVHPRRPAPQRTPITEGSQVVRRKTGAPGLDEMLGGGIPAGTSMMLIGPTGAGKTTLATQFILEGASRGEPGLVVEFERGADDYLGAHPKATDWNALFSQGHVKVIHPKTLDLSADEVLEEVVSAVTALHCKRVVIDSLSGFEMALAPAFREEFYESTHRLIGTLVALGVTVLMTSEVIESYVELRLNPSKVSFLADGLILQRYVELEGQLRSVISVIKMRGFAHSKELRLYEIGADGISVGRALTGYDGLLTGLATLRALPHHEET